MRIAQVAPLHESVPPRLYGGTERVVSWLTEELVALGHDVTLFASGDSITNARLVPASKKALRLDPECVDPIARHVLLAEKVFRQARKFDLIHFHIDYLHYSLWRREDVPCLTTLHGRLDLPDLVGLYKEFCEVPLVSISDAQREPLPFVNWMGTVHHGMPKDELSFHSERGDYLAFLGRVSPEKGLADAIQIAIRSGMKLKIAAKIDRVDRDHFERDLKPLLDHPLIEFIGEIGHSEKDEFLGNAAALLFPINWPEPFGLVMIEAMACGTPVIAYPCGSVPEIILHGVTGFLVHDIDGAVDAVRHIGDIDRRRCRKHFELHFTDERMARDYLRIYKQLTRREASPITIEKGVLKWVELESPSTTT
ncbi:MAG TPA: glycosyltransferase family 4 protein [Candidatus Sulfotelmatobacter sp.]|nr:glycosyltransferase family 4 protein [Candidatus Sulfotelmatobacter sp.]